MLTQTPETPTSPDDLSGHLHRQLIGYIGLVLPVVLILLTLWRDGVERWRNLDSISAYFYTGAVAAFVGMLVSLSLFLFTYRGYKNKHQRADRLVGIVAAVAALGVALFPTSAPGDVVPLSWWSPTTGLVHYTCAATLFAMFAVYALWLFRITAPGQPAPDKARRNKIYLACGALIVAGIVWAAVAHVRGQPIFLPESVALVAFSVSWLVKGQAHTTIARGASSLLAWK
jgi:uncharacterized membrane-anchored protein